MTSTDGRKSSTGKSHKPRASHPWRGKSYDNMVKRKRLNEQRLMERSSRDNSTENPASDPG